MPVDPATGGTPPVPAPPGGTPPVPAPPGGSGPVLEVTDLVKHFPAGGGQIVHAVDGVSLSIGTGQVLGLVGESGSGKSTVARCVLRLTAPTAGTIRLGERDITHLSRRRLRPVRRDMHIVFQDPYSSLNPRMTVGQIVGEPLRRHRLARGRAARERVVAALEQVGLREQLRHRYPHELSGGQRQRVGLARALILRPRLVVADEPVSALDVSVRASVLNLVADLQRDMGFSCLFITHDLSVVEFLADRIAVMYLGQIVETGTREQIFTDPRHPYTQALLSAAPVPDPVAQRARRRIVLGGDPPSPTRPPSGCRFHTRCPVAVDRCRTEVPALHEHGGAGPGGPGHAGHATACHLVTAEGGPRLVSEAA